MTSRATRRFLVALLLVGPALVIGAVFLVLPKAETPRADPLPEGHLQLVAQGNVTEGGPGRPASGVVHMFWNGTGHVLRFEGYEAESGPNVWFFLAASAAADSAEAVEDEGVMLRVPGPGHATFRGDFNVPLPVDVDPVGFGALVAWDRTLNERFSVAPLEPVADPAEADGP